MFFHCVKALVFENSNNIQLVGSLEVQCYQLFYFTVEVKHSVFPGRWPLPCVGTGVNLNNFIVSSMYQSLVKYYLCMRVGLSTNSRVHSPANKLLALKMVLCNETATLASSPLHIALCTHTDRVYP